MIQIRNLTVKNFMSVGAASQGIDFDRNDLTLVLGENLDLGGDGSRNGTGKTTIINALSMPCMDKHCQTFARTIW